MPAQTSGDRTLRPAAPDPELLAWLWSAEGLTWCERYFKKIQHARGLFAEIKDDHECRVSPGQDCHFYAIVLGPDGDILSDLKKYGLSGVPGEWYEYWRRSNRT